MIDTRMQAHSVFSRLAGPNPDPELQKSNASHLHFINVLKEVLTTLGGDGWNPEDKKSVASISQQDLQDMVLSNRFDALRVNHGSVDAEQDGSESEDEPTVSQSSQRRPRVQSKKGKGKKKGKKRPQQRPQAQKADDLADVPLESYRIIDDFENNAEEGKGLVTDYLLAVWDTFQEVARLRKEVQDLWHDVAYGGLNSAVAGAVSNVAIAMIRKMDSEMFINFPGNDSFETLWKTVTRGDPDKMANNYHVALGRIHPGQRIETVREVTVDIREQFLFYAYLDLHDFIADYQLNRTGKPTKRMHAEIKDWDPDFDLRRASPEQRIKWRRSYTINWLYDLVNVFASIVVQRNLFKGENHDLAAVDWSPTGPWNKHRRLYGLNEFAGIVTTLAMQKPGAKASIRILPHHVFQLQCIVDSLMTSRGWSIDVFEGHITSAPARDFEPRRDEHHFLDREQKGEVGFFQGHFILNQVFEKDGQKRGKPSYHQVHSAVLDDVRVDMLNWLGESKYMSGLNGIPPSRFTSTNSNGLWHYSPFLCGVGVLEGLELSYLLGMYIWDSIGEPTMIIHLHNMLVCKGYLERPVGLWGSLQDMFPDELFRDGKPPTSDFGKALLSHTSNPHLNPQAWRQASLRKFQNETDHAGMLDVKANRFFRAKPFTQVLRDAEWDLDKIPDTEMPLKSIIGSVRVCQTELVRDQKTGALVPKETDLVRRARKAGIDVDSMVKDGQAMLGLSRTGQPVPPSVQPPMTTPDGYSTRMRQPVVLDNSAILGFVKSDARRFVCGAYPTMALSWLWITIQVFMTINTIERNLKEARNSDYIETFESGRYPDRRTSLVLLALNEQNDATLSIMADVFENLRTGVIPSSYWDDLDENTAGSESKANASGAPDCLVM